MKMPGLFEKEQSKIALVNSVVAVIIIILAAAAGPVQQGHFHQGGHNAAAFEQVMRLQQCLLFRGAKGADHRQ